MKRRNGKIIPTRLIPAQQSRTAEKCPAAVLRFALCIIAVFLPMGAFAGDLTNALSLQGFTGLLNTPNAEVTDEGKLDILYSDQIERQWRGDTPWEDNYIFSVGFFSFAEIGGRLTDAPLGGVRDLSGNLKIKVPFIPHGYYLPDIAVGMQDIGGGLKRLQTKYAVATEELWRFRVSLGVGTGPDRMKGLFGGIEFKAFDWLYLIGENDTKEKNVGSRLVTRDLFGLPVNLQVTAKTSLDYRPGHWEFGFGLQIPLGNDHDNRTPLPGNNAGAMVGQTKEQAAQAAEQTSRLFQELPANASETKGAPATAASGPGVLLERLTQEGFENVRVGTKGDALLVVEYENRRYDYNELDALGVVLGLVVESVPPGYETLRLVSKKQDIRVIELSAPLADVNAFLRDPGAYERLNSHLRITANIEDESDVDFIAAPENPSRFDSTLVIYPGLKTFVGTEAGVFDYLLSAKLDYYLTLWKGAVADARWDIPLIWSSNFDDDKPFRNDRGPSQLDRLMLFQALKITPGVMVNLGGGMILHDSYGTLNEVLWAPGDGTHRFTFKQAYASSASGAVSRQTHEVYLGSYRYFLSSLDLSLEATAGRFFNNDEGFRAELKRFFGDTAFSVYYSNTRTTDREWVQVGGAMITLPLTLRRDMKPGLVQVKGSDDWSYSQETKIAKNVSQGNFVSTSTGINPTPPFNLSHIFYNRDRLNEGYIRKHLLRLRDAYLTYARKAS